MIRLIRESLDRRLAEVERGLAGEEVIRATRRANYFGRASASMAQLRGNGVLVLATRELVFCMLAPRREYRVPLESVVDVGYQRSFKGKTVGGELLVVHYRDEYGVLDALCFWVPEPRKWGEAILATSGSLKPEPSV